MTSKQKEWLDGHPEYRPIGNLGAPGGLQTPFGPKWTKRGTLHPDGRFEMGVTSGGVDGAFVVGIFTHKPTVIETTPLR